VINSLDKVIQKIKSEVVKHFPSKELKGNVTSPLSELGGKSSPFRGSGGLISEDLNDSDFSE